MTDPNTPQKPNILKFLILIVVILAVFGVILYLAIVPQGGTYIKEKVEEASNDIVMTITGENKGLSYNAFIVDEWNGFRFKYRSDWSVKKDYDESGNFLGIRLDSQKKTSDNDSIYMGNGKNNCEDAKMVKCIMSGYGLILQPIYTYSNNNDAALVYEGIVRSIISYQGKNEYDIEKIHNIINIFIEAEKSNDFAKAKTVMSIDLLNNYDSRAFGLVQEGKIGRHEFVENSKYLSTGYYEVPTKTYAYVSDEKNEIGYWNYSFKVRIINGEYLIDDIIINEFQSK